MNLVGFYYKNTNNIVANILISRAENQGNEFENCTQDVAVECDDFQVNLPVNMREKKEKKKKRKRGTTAVKFHLIYDFYFLKNYVS